MKREAAAVEKEERKKGEVGTVTTTTKTPESETSKLRRAVEGAWMPVG